MVDYTLWRAIVAGTDISNIVSKIEEKGKESEGPLNPDLGSNIISSSPSTLEVSDRLKGLFDLYEGLKDDAKIQISLEGDNLLIFSPVDLREKSKELKEIYAIRTHFYNGVYRFTVPFTASNAFLLRKIVKVKPQFVPDSTKMALTEKANEQEAPYGEMSTDGSWIMVNVPDIETYVTIMKRLNGRKLKSGEYRIPVARLFDLVSYNQMMDSSLPPIVLSDKVMEKMVEDLNGFDGTLDSLRSIPVSELSCVKANYQTYGDMRSSKKSLTDKLSEYGTGNLYDLAFNFPRKYIDKSKPQDISDLTPDENTTLVGKISKIFPFSYRNGTGSAIKFTLETPPNGRKIDVTFFSQPWLEKSFKIGQEVLITGKVSFFNRKLNINGASIEAVEDAAILPIVPIYKQSGTKGVHTGFILNAQREMFSRLNDFKEMEYLSEGFADSIGEVLKGLHLPETTEEMKKAFSSMAKLELFFTQVELQEYESKSSGNRSMRIGPETSLEDRLGTVKKATDTLPYTLTGDQKMAIKTIFENMNKDKPMDTLLNADVGSGKTIIALHALLRAYESGFQSCLISPTNELGTQLYQGLVSFISDLDEDERPVVGYLGAATPARERNSLVKAINKGEVDIVVGTHSLIADKVQFPNLGLICVDEEQKFGVEQRDKLLSSRQDGLVPHMLTQTATPIPSSIAKTFYGSMDTIELREKPAGRKTIATEHHEISYLDFLDDSAINHPVWVDIREEAKKGNQSFVITPMVHDTDKVQAASVKGAYKTLTAGALKGLKVEMMYGGMKSEDSARIMTAFKAGEVDVLIGSTVVEVGVDVPGATRVVILNAERFGASVLHQIRGRVGRNDKESKCYLIAEEGKGTERMEAMIQFSNGFDIAKADLESRNEGVVFSSEQSGSPAMRFASIIKNKDLIEETRKEALRVWESEYREKALEDSKNILKISK